MWEEQVTISIIHAMPLARLPFRAFLQEQFPFSICRESMPGCEIFHIPLERCLRAASAAGIEGLMPGIAVPFPVP